MKIGIDADGVILDYERVVRAKAEIFDLLELKGNGVVNKEEHHFQKIYNWSETQILDFINKFFMESNKVTPLVAGAKEVINYLKQDGHELIVITARGGFIEEMKDAAEEIFAKNNLTFDKIYWKADDKLSICQKENIDVMIDDYYVICEEISRNKIKTLYFRDKDMKKLQENEYLKEVSNWGEIYRYIKNL